MITIFGYIGRASHRLRDAVAEASLVVGGARHLDALGVEPERRVVLGAITPAIEALAALPSDQDAVVIASGDPLFYGVVRRMRQAGLMVKVVPAVSSLQLAFAAVALPWEDAVLVSAHGLAPETALAVCRDHPKVGVLTDTKTGLPQIAAFTRGQGKTFVLAERLGESDERVRVLNEADALAVDDIAQPNVVLVLAYHPDDPRALGTHQPIAGMAQRQENA